MVVRYGRKEKPVKELHFISLYLKIPVQMKAKPCIWIIDDDINDIELMESVILGHMPGVNIVSFKDGESVLAEMENVKIGCLKKGRFPGLIILDLKMPVRDGFEMYRLIRTVDLLRFVPVVMFSSSGMDEDIRKSYNLGVNAFVSKPVSFENFERTLHSTVDFWLNTCEVTEDQQS
jgi:CheY-like chemotaxis protein